MEINTDLYIKQLATLTGLSETSLKGIFKANMLVLSHEIKSQERETDTSPYIINLGTYGQLEIENINNRLRFKFNGSAEFNKVVRSTILEDKNLLTDKLDDKLVKHILKTYKELI